MQNIVVIGAGTAGTLIAHELAGKLDPDEWSITVVDRDDDHHYQPGYLFVPFGMMPARRVSRPRHAYLPRGVTYLVDGATAIDRTARTVTLASGRVLDWDRLVITTGTEPRPDLVPGMTGTGWNENVFEFYTLEGAAALRPALKNLRSGRLVVQVCEMPIKCPVAPLEFALLAQDHFRRRGLSWQVDITYVTPLDGAFTKPVASARLGSMLAERGIEVVTDFQIEHVDGAAREIVSYDGRRVPYDLLVTVPPNRGSAVVTDSGLGDESGFVPVDRYTLRSEVDPDVWVVGDAANAPTSKAGSVVHFEVQSFIPNFLASLRGEEPSIPFDGHANCFVESGRGQAMLLDFSYDVEPLPGRFPLPRVGPMSLLKPTCLNHLGKRAFELVYWQMLVKGRPLPFPRDMSMAGKKADAAHRAAYDAGRRAAQEALTKGDTPAQVGADARALHGAPTSEGSE